MTDARPVLGGLQPHHIAFSAPDLGGAVHCWGGAFGLQVAHRFTLREGVTLGAFLDAGDIRVELFQRESSAPRERRPEPAPSQDRVDADLLVQGMRHSGFRVADLDAVVGELERRGVAFVRGPRTFPIDDQLTVRVAFFQDPYGNLCELVQDVDPLAHGGDAP